MIVTVVGGSAHSTPALADALGSALADVPGGGAPVTLRLAGRRAGALAAVTRACTLVCDGTPVSVESCAAAGWDDAVTGCDVALVQLRVGGYAARAFDESFPLDAGVPGDEGLGPGGLAAAYRTWPQLSDWLGRIAARAPRARVILLTSPGGLLVRLAAAAHPALAVVHVCELPTTTLQQLCAAVGERPETVAFDHAGVNHLGWLYDVRDADGRDLLVRHAALAERPPFPSRRLVRASRAFPLRYLRLHYERAAVVREQRAMPVRRAEQLMRVADQALETFRTGAAAEVREALARRPAPWYAEAVVPLIRTWMGHEVATPLFLTYASPGREVVERRCRAAHGTPEEVPPVAPPPEPLARLTARFVRYERRAAAAVLDGSEDALADALAAHPWVRSRAAAGALARTIVRHTNINGYRRARDPA